MFVLLAFLAVASAAPHYGYHNHRHHNHGEGGLGFAEPQSDSEMDMFTGQMFDAHQFWRELSEEMHRMDQMLNEFSKHFPTTTSNEGVENNEYCVTISLTGFDEQDIAVKAREGVLMIQAVHKTEDSNEKTYIDLRTLPTYVNVNGTWTYDKDILKITFPLKERPKEADDVTEEMPITTEASTEDIERSREHMEPTSGYETMDADVGLGRGDVDRERELLTNVIYPYRPVEATTYSVDLKNDVEFVPMKIYKH